MIERELVSLSGFEVTPTLKPIVSDMQTGHFILSYINA